MPQCYMCSSSLPSPSIFRPCPASPSAVTASPSRKEPRLVGRDLAAARRRTRSGRPPGSPFQVSYLSSRMALSANFYSYSFFIWILVRSLRCRQMLSTYLLTAVSYPEVKGEVKLTNVCREPRLGRIFGTFFTT